MKRTLWFLFILILLAQPELVFANGQDNPKPTPNKDRVIRPDLGDENPRLVPGVNGYKVFEPGAIVEVPLIPTNSTGQFLELATVGAVRGVGATDVYYDHMVCNPLCTWYYNGSHETKSNLVEDQIWVDGWLRRKNQTAWRDDCTKHRSGVSRAWCGTSYSYACTDSYGESQHYWHKSGYVDVNATTNDIDDRPLCS